MNTPYSDMSAIIPMKGHSERIPAKNLRPLNGKPLFYWIISEIAKCGIDIYVDTDSEAIIDAVAKYFDTVKFIVRPESLRGDAVPMNEVLGHDLTRINSGHFIQTHSTSPLLTAKTIKAGIDAYYANLGEYDSLYSVSAIRARCFTSDGQPVNHNPGELIQTQYLPPVYVENSGFYIFSRESFAKNRHRIGTRPLQFAIDPYEAIDIDDENDFVVADILCAALKGKGLSK